MSDQEEPRVLREGHVRSEPEERAVDLAHQRELDEAVAELRAKNEADLAANESANYARTHAIIERDENGNPIEKPEQE